MEDVEVKKKVRTVLHIMSSKRGKQLSFMLKGQFCYRKNGDIQIILNRDAKRLEIHKAIEAKAKDEKTGKSAVGVDKGIATLLSCSSDKEYSERFGELVNAEAERINKRNTERNKYIQQKKKLVQRIKVLDDVLNRIKTGRIPLIQEKKGLERQVKHLEEHHLGKRKYNRQHQKAVARMETEINRSIRQMLKEEKPDVLVKEDLSFTREKTDRKKGHNKQLAKINRKFSSWTKGTLDERIEYICETQGIKTVNVNPAYTSQFCPICGAPLGERTGAHHEVAHCPNCGEMNANTSAAKVILQRWKDEEISIYTKYTDVKEIMLKRYKETKTKPA